MIRNFKRNTLSMRKNQASRCLKNKQSWKFLHFLEFKENLRMRLLIDVGHLLGKIFINKNRDELNPIFYIDHLITYHSDDASSIKIALKVREEYLNLFSLILILRFTRSHRFIMEHLNIISINHAGS
jgi:hypothetical protein